MTKEKIIQVVIIAVVAVAVVALLAVLARRGAQVGPAGPNATSTGSATRGAVGNNVKVPEVGSTSTPKDVAVPQNVAPGSPSGNTKLRTFSMNIDGDKFTPKNTFIVNLWDTVHIDISAVDKSYDFFQPDYGLKVSFTKGQTKAAEFQAATAGKFTFYCQSCGGPANGPVGYLMVMAP